MLSISQRDFSSLNEIVRVYHVDMPCKIRGYTQPFPDGYYAVFLNSRLSWEQNVESLNHELRHIANGDLSREIDVTATEDITHNY